MIEAVIDNLLDSRSVASARYSSTRGFSGRLTTGSTFVLLPMPKRPGLVVVVANGLYWLASLRALLAKSADERAEKDDPGRIDEAYGGVRGLMLDDIEFLGICPVPCILSGEISELETTTELVANDLLGGMKRPLDSSWAFPDPAKLSELESKSPSWLAFGVRVVT